jgi:hypothetical protein
VRADLDPRAPGPGSRVPVVDLHLHTTASDGLDSPEDLVSRALEAGIAALAVTDHDTLESVGEVARCAAECRLAFVSGIEITSVWKGSDVHLLAYFVDPRSTRLTEFLADQRADRQRRARRMAANLAALGVPVDVETVIASCKGGVVSRPHLAYAMVQAGHVPDLAAAFDRYLGQGQPAYVPRSGAAPMDVITLVTAAGGFVSMAHPGVTGCDDLIPDLAAEGLGALEVHHPDHLPDDTVRYLALAEEYGLAVSGGSDYHGEKAGRENALGRVGLSEHEFAAFCVRAGRPVPEVPRAIRQRSA